MRKIILISIVSIFFGCGPKESTIASRHEKEKRFGQYFNELVSAVDKGDAKGLAGLEELWETEKQGVEYKEVSRDKLAYYFYKRPTFVIRAFIAYDPDKLDWMYRVPEDSPENITNKEYYEKILKELKGFRGSADEMAFTKRVIINLTKKKYLYGL